MLSRLKLAFKLPAMVVLIALLTGLSVTIVGFLIGDRTVREQAEQRLTSVSTNTAATLESYFTEVAEDLQVFAGRAEIGASIDAFAGALYTLKRQGDPTALLQDAYIASNPNPAEERMLLDTSDKLSVYDLHHRALHPDFRDLLEKRGYSDILLFDGQGSNVYTVRKEEDFGTNFNEGAGPWADTDLGKVYRAAAAGTEGQVFLSDFAPYGPSGGTAASFIAAPVIDQGFLIGVLAFQMPADRIADELSSTLGLGETGQVFLVGQDGIARNDSPRTASNDALSLKLEGAPITAALGGRASEGEIMLDGAAYAVAATPLSFGGIDWAVVALESQDAIAAPSVALRNTMMVMGLVMLVIAVIASLLIARTITRPITRLNGAMAEIAADRLDIDVPGLERGDELGDMARAVEVFRSNGLTMRELHDQEEGAHRQRASYARMMEGLQDDIGQVVGAALDGDFSRRVGTDLADERLRSLAASVNAMVESVEQGLADVGQVLGALAEANLGQRMRGEHKGAFARLQDDANRVADTLSDIVGQLRGTSRSLKTATGEILSGANDLSERTTRQAATIEETSAAIEQLSRTVTDNASHAENASRQALDVARAADSSADVMGQATEAMDRITQASAKISSIIGMIDDIAFQTNLLALNASVEAARAGEAGQGFAVVAVEVRRLAQSTAEASKEVKTLIEQSDEEVRSGSTLVADASERLLTVRRAIDANTALLADIARASRAQASAIDEVSVAVRQMDEMTQHNAALVEETNAAIEQTEAQAGDLDRVVGTFTLAERGNGGGAPERGPRLFVVG